MPSSGCSLRRAGLHPTGITDLRRDLRTDSAIRPIANPLVSETGDSFVGYSPAAGPKRRLLHRQLTCTAIVLLGEREHQHALFVVRCRLGLIHIGGETE